MGGTYGGNPLACAAALGAIATMRELDLASRARSLGELMTQRLAEMAARYPVIGDIRGRGAMLAMELVEAGTKTPNAAAAAQVNAACHAAGVMTLTCGTFGNVFRFLPPLVIPDHLVHEAFDVLDKALAEATA
ncbi:MAG: aminotransferase class III-fold pyridoxal phosphate-dependent enzyme [Nocardioidaceae bacterium]